MKPIILCAVLCLWCGSAFAEVPEVVIQTVAMEAANQSDYGQYLVASVIVNRAKGGSLERVCLARKQFSCWNDHKWAKTWLDKHYTTSVRLRAYNAIKKAIVEPYPGITHYHTTNIKPFWAKGHRPAVIEGDHAFYEEIR